MSDDQLSEVLQHPRFRNDPGYEFEVRAKAKETASGLTIRKDQSRIDSGMGGYMLVDSKEPEVNVMGGSNYDRCLWEIDLYLDDWKAGKVYLRD